MTPMHWRFSALALTALLLGGTPLFAQADKPAKKSRDVLSFGVLESMTPEAARAKAEEWLKDTGKLDANQKAFDEIWSGDRPLLDKVAETFVLGDDEAAKLLKDARDPESPPPTAVPPLLKDAKKPAFFRANLALAYAKALSNRRIYEESLEALKAVQAEQVVDPSAYLFDRAVAEYAMLHKDEAERAIQRLLDDVVDAPERYKMVAALMHFDMLSWQEKDLGWVARMMNNIQRRLDLYRGGEVTQDMQKKIVMQLDDMIKQLEEQRQQQQQANANSKGKNRGKPQGNTNKPGKAADEDYITNIGGPGKVDPKRLRNLAENWGNLPEKERAKAMLELTRDMPPRYRELIENYFKNLARSETAASK